MRLAGQEKMGYYPTPASLLNAIASYLATDESSPCRALDPCCGEGEALAHLGVSLNALETWGAELSPQRAEIAAHVLTKVHSCAWQSCRAGRGSVSLVLCNPPYDDDPLTHTRLEQQFLEDALPALCAGGVLVYLIPQRQLGNPAIARRLAGTLDRIMIVRFPDGEFEAFEQIIVFGVKRARYTAPAQDSIDRITQMAVISPQHIPSLAMQAQPTYIVPSAPQHDLDGRAPVFRRLHWEPEDLIHAAMTQGVRAHSRAWCDALASVDADIVVHPAMPLKKGHIAMLMAAGLMGVMTLEKKDELGTVERIVAKGRVIKTQAVHTEDVIGAGGKVVATKTVSKDVFSTRVCTLDAQGAQEVISDEAGLGAFMHAFGEQLARQVIAKHQPAYDLQPTAEEWQTISRLALNMRLPGRREGGLLPAQKHVAIAAARVMRKRRCAILSAEMGFGKTVTACAAAELLNAYPAIVVCPPHLVRKWAKEILQAVPGAVARVVNCLEKGAENSDENEGVHEDATRFEKSYEQDDPLNGVNATHDDATIMRYSLLDFVRDWRAGKLGEKAFAIVSRERAKLGSGWAPVAGVRKVYARDEGAWVEYLCDPDTGAILLDDAGAQLTHTEASWRFLAAKQRFSQSEPVKGCEVTESENGASRRSGKWGQRVVRTPLFTQGQGTGCLLNLPAVDADGRCQSAQHHVDLTQRVGFRRYPIAAFIHRKLRGFFKLLIADEAHQFKAARSDQAIAFHQISRACRWTLGLTGSLFGGKSTSLFHLAHRTSHDVRADFGVDDERRWAERFGVLETTRWGSQGKADDAGEDGAYSGYGRERVQVRELPGISPGIVRYLLPHVVFARIADLGYELPPYEERVARLDMNPSQATQVWEEVYDPRTSTGWLYGRMLDALKAGDNSLVSVWLQTALARPNSAFRADEVTQLLKRPTIANQEAHISNLSIPAERRKLLCKGSERATLKQLMPTTAPGEWLPKERWLMDYCASEVLRGRKVLVYVRQTGTRDIQPRLAEALREVGLRVKVLRPSVSPERREAWVREQTRDTHVLITNPKLVETGLDLIMFSSVVYAEIDYNLYTLWQSMRRVWRLGQTQPVTVTFLSYRDTLEDLALKLMGKKLYAAQLLYGDEVGGAIVESDDGNFLAELARAAISQTPVDDYAALFSSHMEVEGAAVEAAVPISLPAVLVRIPTTRSVSMSDLRAFVGRQLRRTQMPAAVPETQISLFG